MSANKKLLFAAALAAASVVAPAFGQGAAAARIRGKVLESAGDVVTIDAGQDKGVKERTVYDVFVDARSVRLPMTNETVYVPQRVVAQLVIVDVDARTSRAKVVPVSASEPAGKVEPGALVFSNPYAAARNLAPYLKSVTAQPPKTDFGRPVTVKVEAADERDDIYYFEWAATGGALSHTRSTVPSVVWSPPLVKDKATFKLTVTAVDTGGNRAVGTVDIEASPPGSMKAVYEVKRRLADHRNAFRVCRDLAFDEENSAFAIDSDAVQIVGLDHGWEVKLKSEDYNQPFKGLDRLVVRGGDAYATDVNARRAVRLRIGPKMYQDPPVFSYGSEGTGNGQFQMPVDIGVNANGDVYVLDQMRGCVQIFSGEGQFLASIGALGPGTGQLSKPVALGLAHDGTLFVLDDGRKRVLVYSAEGRLLREFEAGAQAESLADLKVDPFTGRISVLESLSGQVRSFDANGKTSGKPVGIAGEMLAMGTFYRPRRLRYDRLGSLYVIARDGKVLHRCDAAAGEEVARWGGIDFAYATDIAAGPTGDLAVLLPNLYTAATLDRRGWITGLSGGEGAGPGKLAKPIAVQVDAKGNVCVLDQKQATVQVFSARGQPLRMIGKKGSAPVELEEPLDLSIDPSRRWLAVLDDRDEYEVKVFDLQAKFGDELRATFPGADGALEDGLRIAISPSGNINVAMTGGEVQAFNAGPSLASKSTMIDQKGGNTFAIAGRWKLRDMKTPTSLEISNMLLLFAADEEFVQVLDLSRSGALVTKISDPNVARRPSVATVDDFDRVFVWDAKAGNAVELGR